MRALLETVDVSREARWLDEKLGEGGAAPLIEEAESLVQRLESYKHAEDRDHGVEAAAGEDRDERSRPEAGGLERGRDAGRVGRARRR